MCEWLLTHCINLFSFVIIVSLTGTAFQYTRNSMFCVPISRGMSWPNAWTMVRATSSSPKPVMPSQWWWLKLSLHSAYLPCITLGLVFVLGAETVKYTTLWGTVRSEPSSLQALARLSTLFFPRVQACVCADEWQLGAHVAGLHRILAEARYR